jgi:hypothetical protein
MLACLVALLLRAAAADQAAKEELLAAAKKIEAAQSYSFTCNALAADKSEAEDEPEAEPEPQAPPRGGAPRDVWTAKFARGRPIRFQKGQADFFRDGDRFIAIGKNDEWRTVELPERGADGTRRGERLRGLPRMALEIRKIPLPHELLAGLDAKVEEVVRSEKEGRLDFVAKLKKAVVRELMGGGKGARPAGATRPPGGANGEGEKGGDGEEPAQGEPAATAAQIPPPVWSGTLHVVATREGGIELLELDLLSKTATSERKLHRELKLGAVGATNVDVPEPAAKLLAAGE